MDKGAIYVGFGTAGLLLTALVIYLNQDITIINAVAIFVNALMLGVGLGGLHRD